MLGAQIVSMNSFFTVDCLVKLLWYSFYLNPSRRSRTILLLFYPNNCSCKLEKFNQMLCDLIIMAKHFYLPAKLN